MLILVINKNYNQRIMLDKFSEIVSDLDFCELLVCAFVPFLEHLSQRPSFLADYFVIELQDRYDFVSSNNDHFISKKCLFDLNVPERDLFNKSFFFQLFNVLEKLQDSSSLDDGLKSGSSEFLAKNECYVGD